MSKGHVCCSLWCNVNVPFLHNVQVTVTFIVWVIIFMYCDVISLIISATGSRHRIGIMSYKYKTSVLCNLTS